MKTYLATLVLCLAASTAVGQLLQNPDADRAAAEKEKAAAANRDKDKDAAGARAGGPAGAANRRGLNGAGVQGAQGALRGPVGPNPLFEALDADGDGMITKKELRSAAARLKLLDTDGDGNISLAEASAPGLAGAPIGAAAGQFGDLNQMVDQMMLNDKNGDGKLTADELPGQMAQQMIQQGDKDGDGALSKAELTQAMQQGMQNGAGNFPGGAQNGQGNFPGGQNNFAGGGMNQGERQMMGQWMQWDRNGDGMLGANEVPPQAAGLLRGGDLNNDGMISPAELKLLMDRNGERMRNIQGRNPNDLNNAGNKDKDKNEADAKKKERRNSRDT